MIYVLAGTTEGREAVGILQEKGWQVGASVVTSYGSDLLTRQGTAHINQGAFDHLALTRTLLANKVTCLVDATHPYALDISRLAIRVAKELQIPYIRLERGRSAIPDHPLITTVERLEDIQRLIRPKQRVFSTLGSKSLPRLVPIIKQAGAELIARVLPCADAIQLCEHLGLGPDNIVAIKGPFTQALNAALFEQFGVQVMLTKESGSTGGVDEKLAAALACGVTSVVIRRPGLQYPVVVDSLERLIQELERLNGTK